MTKSDVNEKTLQCKINGQSKPFIDKDLQIQIPGLETSQCSSNQKTKSIYIHYCGESQKTPPELQAIENELNSAMAEAKQSHEAWKKIQDRIRETAKV